MRSMILSADTKGIHVTARARGLNAREALGRAMMAN